METLVYISTTLHNITLLNAVSAFELCVCIAEMYSAWHIVACPIVSRPSVCLISWRVTALYLQRREVY
jgi:hypothetical protein